MTDQSNNTPAEETAAAGADESSRRNRARNRVVDYADADDELKAAMDKVMEPIDKSPDSFEAIITFGNEPLDKLGKIANQMITVQSRFNAQVNVMASAMEKLESGMREMNMEKFAEATKRMLKNVAGVGVKGVKGGFSLGKGLVDMFTGASKNKGDDQKLVEEMQQALPTMLNEMIRLVDEITKTEEGIKEVIKEAEKLGLARIEATRTINVYLGAGKEIIRRYNEEYIPEAQADFDELADPEDEMYLKDVLKRKDDFIDRLTVLEGSRAAGVIAAQQLKQIMDTMEDQLKKIQDIKYNSQNEWKAMLAAAGIAGSSLKAAQTIKQADEFGDKMHDQTMKMIEDAHQMTLNSKARGTIDPQKLIDASNRLQKMIENENSARADRMKRLEEVGASLRNASDKLIEAVSASDQKRILEGVQDAEAERSGSNDNKSRKSRTRTPKM